MLVLVIFFKIFSLMNCISVVESDICIFINKEGKFLKNCDNASLG